MRARISKRVKKIIAGFTASTVVVAAILIFASTQSTRVDDARSSAEALENIFYDLFFKMRSFVDDNDIGISDKITIADGFDPSILIVDIDEPSLEKLGPFNEWDRNVHANVVNNLSQGGASVISFDIIFKTADFGKKKAEQVLQVLGNIAPNEPWDSTYSDILAYYNYDSMLVAAIKESGNTIVSNMFSEAKAYKHESQWRKLSGEARAQEIGLSSTIFSSQVDRNDYIESKDLLDNIFPELAQAGAGLGSVNAYPDNDGVVRRIFMFYRFPNMEIPQTTDTSLTEISHIDSSHIYTTMSLMTILHLFHIDPKDINIKMGKYIEIGKPFGIYRDSSGFLHTTYPNFSYPMFAELRKILAEKKIEKTASKAFVDISSKIIAKKDSSGNLTLDFLEEEDVDAKVLLRLTESMFDSVKENKPYIINRKYRLSFNEDEPDGEHFIFKELKPHDDEEDEGINVTRYIVKTVQFFADSLKRIPNGKSVHLSLDMDIHYDRNLKKWKSSQVILSDAVIRDIKATNDETIQKLKPGEELRFGPVKRIPIDIHGGYQVNFKGRYNVAESKRTFQHLSYKDVATGNVDPGVYQGKIFILGSAAAALFDFMPVPSEENYPAVLIHATIIKNVLEDDYLITLSEKYQDVIVVLLALLCLIIGLFLKSYFSVALTLVLMAIYTVVAYKYFEGGLYIGVSKQILAMFLTNITALVVLFYFENKEKSFINNAFKQYVSPELIDAMVENEIPPELGGKKSHITAYFTDIANFSTFSEKIGNPSKLVDLLNEYLTAMTDTLLANKGTLDKYEGDAIIAFFGAPYPLPNHAQYACETAVYMQEKLKELRKKWASEQDNQQNPKWPKVVQDMHMRIGINSGDIVTGNMGSTMRKNYTMMGDAVNLAARLESAAKQYGAYIQISEDTQRELMPNTFIYRSLDTIRVVGKSLPVNTFEVLAITGEGVKRKAALDREEYQNSHNKKTAAKKRIYSPSQAERAAQRRDKENQKIITLVEIWEKARKCYLNMQWDEAIELFTQCLELEPHHPDRDPGSKTTPSQVYINRCEAYKLKPPVEPGKAWDGVFIATEK